MSALKFQWDSRKATSNKKKHGVSFDEAQTVFLDENARYISDPDSSHTEERFLILGLSRSLRLLTVCYCYRIEPETIRIISARKATRTEAKWYSPN